MCASFPVPEAAKHLHTIILPSPCFTVGKVLLFKDCFGFSPNIAPLVETKELNFRFICPQNILQVVESLV